MRLRKMLYGMATVIPGVSPFRVKGTGGTDNARYCYSVWARHLVMARDNGLNPYPKTVAELGPGDSLGIGLAALISGCDRYFAFDVVEYANIERNVKVFDELVMLFKNRSDIPNDDEFPKIKPYVSAYSFPHDIFDESHLLYALDKSRLEMIREAIINPYRDGSPIEYRVPWFDPHVIEREAVDTIYSQAVLEHVDDLKNTYAAMHMWLKPTGYISHQIDFKSHGTADEWNGHWAYSDFTWKVIRGRRPYLLNREPHSIHLKLLNGLGFRVVCDQTVKSESRLTKDDLARKYASMTDDDLSVSGAFIQAVKC